MPAVFDQLLYICSGISVVAAAVAVISSLIGHMKKPEQTQNERIAALEREVETFRTFFGNDKERIDQIEKGNRVTQKAILALMSHALNGNDTVKLKDAKNQLEEYLIGR